MQLFDEEISIGRVISVVGLVVFLSTIAFFVVLTAHYIAQKKITIQDKAKERIQTQPISPSVGDQ